MNVLFVEYPACTTCKKAKKWLDERQVSYEDRHIKEQNPTLDELKQWHKASGLPLKKSASAHTSSSFSAEPITMQITTMKE